MNYKIQQLNSIGNWIFVAGFEGVLQAASYERRLIGITRIVNSKTGKEVIAF